MNQVQIDRAERIE